MAQVQLKGVRKVFPGGVEAVKSADLVVDDKEFLVLVGPSGCGKSTTLRMIAGLEEVTEGEIYIDGRLVNDVPPKNRDIAMVFQNYALYPHMTVYKNMAFGLILRKTPKKEIQERVQDAARILGIEELLDRKPKALSGGERQRVAVGRAIVRKPKVFLFDEPLSNLDAKLRVQMRAEISRLHTRLESTMIYVTHDQVEAMTMGDRIVVMLDGEIQQVADPLTLYGQPVNRFVAGFIGSPPMNMIDCTIASENGALFLRDETGQLDLAVDATHRAALDAYAGKKVTFGIRPEDMYGDVEEAPVSGGSITANVEVVEPMGAEIYLYLCVAGKSITARINSECRPEVDKPYEIKVAMDKAHFFDTDTEQAIV